MNSAVVPSRLHSFCYFVMGAIDVCPAFSCSGGIHTNVVDLCSKLRQIGRYRADSDKGIDRERNRFRDLEWCIIRDDHRGDQRERERERAVGASAECVRACHRACAPLRNMSNRRL